MVGLPGTKHGRSRSLGLVPASSTSFEIPEQKRHAPVVEQGPYHLSQLKCSSSRGVPGYSRI